PGRRALGEGDDPRRDRPAARRPAADRGTERLLVRRRGGDAGPAQAVLREERRRASGLARDAAVGGPLRAAPGRRRTPHCPRWREAIEGVGLLPRANHVAVSQSRNRAFAPLERESIRRGYST